MSSDILCYEQSTAALGKESLLLSFVHLKNDRNMIVSEYI